MVESPNLQEKIARRFSEQADKIARQMAAKIGTPSDSQDISLEEELALWNTRNPAADPSQLLQENMPIDQIVDTVYPNRRKMMMQGRPNPEEWVKYSDKMKEYTDSGEYTERLPDPGPMQGVQGVSPNPSVTMGGAPPDQIGQS